MDAQVVYILVVCCILVTSLSEAEHETIILTQSKAETHFTQQVGKDTQQINCSLLLPSGFQASLVNSSDPDVTVTEDGQIEMYSPNPRTQSLSVAIQDLRNSTNPNITQLCPTFYADINFNIIKKKTTGLCGEPPALKKPIDYISLTVGQLFRMKLDPDYFCDAEDGDTRQLYVTMTTGYGNPLPNNHWIQFDSNDQVIYGLALNESVVRNEVLLVVAEDSCGQSTYDAVGVDVAGKIDGEYASTMHIFVVDFSEVPNCPVKDLKNLYVFVEELKMWFNNQEIFIAESENCSLRLLMAEKRYTLSEDRIYEETRKIFDEKGEITVEFLCFFMPGFRITKFEHFMQNYSSVEEENDMPFVPFKSDINLWFEIVLPVIIILFLFIVLVIIVYICCTRKKKLYLLQSEKPTFLEERRPVILQTEVPVEDPSLCPRNPTILSHYDELPSSEMELIDQRSLPSTPDYTPPITQPPPAYRVPPPYTNNHQYW